jgi:hypothetical protein
MRRLADPDRIKELMRRLGQQPGRGGRVYLTGGASALLIGWRQTTIDVDLMFDADAEPLLRAVVELKEALEINVELASPADFIPELPGWRDRSRFIAREGRLDFLHYDFYAQALAKVERGHATDMADVAEMVTRQLVQPAEALRLFGDVEPELYRYPAIDAASFRRQVEAAFSA